MKSHYCKIEKTTIDFEGECNWCGEKEWQGLNYKEKNQCKMLENFKTKKQSQLNEYPDNSKDR
jgi:hypothetical protein